MKQIFNHFKVKGWWLCGRIGGDNNHKSLETVDVQGISM